MSNESRSQFTTISIALSEGTTSDLTDEQLLDLYLTSPKKLRDELFMGTANAAEVAGVTQRTIQLWIETGLIRAVRIGGTYRVNLASIREYLKNRVARLG